MTIVVNATYVNGSFQPSEPLSLAEGTEVRLAITPVEQSQNGEVNDQLGDFLAPVIGICDGPLAGDFADHHDELEYDAVSKKGTVH